MFQVTQEIHFCYGHRLLNYEGKYKHLHGHNARAIITLERETLDDKGMVVDFSDIKKTIRTWIEDELDHRMILSEEDPVLPMLKELGEPLFVIPSNPTAENIAKIIFDYAKEKGLPVVEVRLWETANSYATYQGNC